MQVQFKKLFLVGEPCSYSRSPNWKEISSGAPKGDRRSGKGREMEKAHCQSVISNEIQNPNQNVTELKSQVERRASNSRQGKLKLLVTTCLALGVVQCLSGCPPSKAGASSLGTTNEIAFSILLVSSDS